MNRNSAKLERVASPYQADTRTRSELSFDIDKEVDESTGGDERERSVAQASAERSSPRRAISRLSQKMLQRLEGGSTGGSGSESTSVGESTSQEASPKRVSRRLFGLRLDSTEAPLPKREESNGGQAITRKSRQFLPKALSMLRISTRASEKAEEEDDVSGRGSAPPEGSSTRDDQGGEDRSPRSSNVLIRREPEQSPSSSLTATPRRTGSRFFLGRRQETGSPPALPEHIDVRLYEALIQIILDVDQRDRLVETLLAQHVDGGSAKVRFVSAVDDWDRLQNKADRTVRGKKIMATFLQPDASFRLPGIPRDQLAAVTLDTLPLMRTRIIIDLLENAVVAEFVRSYAAATE